jgi:hypothetical protein
LTSRLPEPLQADINSEAVMAASVAACLTWVGISQRSSDVLFAAIVSTVHKFGDGLHPPFPTILTDEHPFSASVHLG